MLFKTSVKFQHTINNFFISILVSMYVSVYMHMYMYI